MGSQWVGHDWVTTRRTALMNNTEVLQTTRKLNGCCSSVYQRYNSSHFWFFICNSSLPILVFSNNNDSCNNKPLSNIHILYINKKFPKDLVGKLDMTDTSSNKQKKIDIYWDTEDYGRKYQGFNFGYVVLTHYIAIRHVVRDRSANLSFFPPCFPPLPPFLSLVPFSFLLFFLSLLFLPFLNLFLCFSFLPCFLPFILFFLSLLLPFPHSVLHAIPPFGQALTAHD